MNTKTRNQLNEVRKRLLSAVSLIQDENPTEDDVLMAIEDVEEASSTLSDIDLEAL